MNLGALSALIFYNNRYNLVVIEFISLYILYLLVMLRTNPATGAIVVLIVFVIIRIISYNHLKRKYDELMREIEEKKLVEDEFIERISVDENRCMSCGEISDGRTCGNCGYTRPDL